MSIIMFTVECPEHGIMQISSKHPDTTCPTLCFIPVKEHRLCGRPLKRIYDIPNVHFHGSGFTKTSQQ
jgi:predicted nucleic acid-binding Zn ribbon protein